MGCTCSFRATALLEKKSTANRTVQNKNSIDIVALKLYATIRNTHYISIRLSAITIPRDELSAWDVMGDTTEGDEPKARVREDLPHPTAFKALHLEVGGGSPP
jgi:hypothetical protein